MKSTVLLIDDDPLDLKPIQMLMESWNMETIPVRSGKSALEHLKTTTVDLVVSDVRMPGMSGEEVVQSISENHPGLPVILVTGKGDIQSAVTAMKLGAFDYVLKPPDEHEFRLTVDRAIEHGRLRRENEFLRSELAAGGMYGERMIGNSPQMLEVFETINKVAHTDSTVLITGETGTGKELVAQTIHFKSSRSKNPFVALNCASLNQNLVESELFGHEKGAFTGATSARRGRFEDADGGTLFLDEIAETTQEFQAKLLRVLQENQLERLGSSRTIPVDVRVLASTNRDLKKEVEIGSFREDLYYRLCVIPVHLPPLRERPEDIGLLASHFADYYGREYGSSPKTISAAGIAELSKREWKGNVRELQHTIERAVVLSSCDVLEPDDIAPIDAAEEAPDSSEELHTFLDTQTRQHLLKILDKTGWHKNQAAEILGIDRVTLYRMLKKFSISR